MKKSIKFAVSFLIISILLFSIIFATVLALEDSRTASPCSDKKCQIDKVWVLMQDKLRVKNTEAGKGIWLGRNVWNVNDNSWKSFDEVYPRGGAIPAPVIEHERGDEEGSGIADNTPNNLEPTGIGQRVRSQDELKRRFGNCQENSNYDTEKIITINLFNKPVRVHKDMKSIFLSVEQNVRNANVNFDYFKSVQGYVCRENKNNNDLLSSHAFGITVDINPDENQNYKRGNTNDLCTNTLPKEVIKAFKDNGFCWGGQFTTVCDAMHFEYCKPEETPPQPTVT